VAAMGLCKCRKVTTLFCFQCRINVCDTCIVSGWQLRVRACQHALLCRGTLTLCRCVMDWNCNDHPCLQSSPRLKPLLTPTHPHTQVEKHKTCVVNKYMQWLLDSECVSPHPCIERTARSPLKITFHFCYLCIHHIGIGLRSRARGPTLFSHPRCSRAGVNHTLMYILGGSVAV
jgi:hypothetical protein